MMKRAVRRSAACVFGLLLALMVAYVIDGSRRPPPPVYAGKTIFEWIALRNGNENAMFSLWK